jgi:hypothetical protein
MLPKSDLCERHTEESLDEYRLAESAGEDDARDAWETDTTID